MSAERCEYHVNVPAANELERQATRAKQILERLAAHLAATQPSRAEDFKDLVEQEHVRRAAELLFGYGHPCGILRRSARPVQSISSNVVENGQQLDRLIQKLKEMCSG